MDFASTWPVAIIMGLLLLTAATPLMRAADTPPIEEPSRVEGLDGLRGFLALAVFYSHTIIYHQYLLTGVWKASSFPFFTMLGQGGVSIFFMITGYLFWSQLVAKNGRPNWVSLYVGRAFRILPLYWFAVCLVLLEVVAHTGLHLREGVARLCAELAYWAAGGLRPESPINGYGDTSVLIARVTWTLGYEWKFYASLILLSFLARDRRIRTIAPFVGLVILLAWIAVRARSGEQQAGLLVCSALFLCGICVATIARVSTDLKIHGALGSVVFVVLMTAVWLFYSTIFSVIPIIALALCFFMVIERVTIFGLLSCRPARRLGNISFGIYLLQGPVLAASFLLPGVRAAALASPLAHWLIMTADAVVLVLLATLTHAWIERPGIKVGKAAALRLNRSPVGVWFLRTTGASSPRPR